MFHWKIVLLAEQGVHIHMNFVLIKKYQFTAVFVAASPARLICLKSTSLLDNSHNPTF